MTYQYKNNIILIYLKNNHYHNQSGTCGHFYDGFLVRQKRSKERGIMLVYTTVRRFGLI